VAGMGPGKRPGSTGERTETLAYRKGPQLSRTEPNGRIQYQVCRLRIAVPFDRSVAGPRRSMSRFDDRRPSITEPER
jgi:hypothetical protein